MQIGTTFRVHFGGLAVVQYFLPGAMHNALQLFFTTAIAISAADQQVSRYSLILTSLAI